MNNYNIRLSELRKEAKLSIREAAKTIGINRWKLYFYENGYFRPTKKDLKKLSEFYKVDLSLEGMDAYPAPVKEKALTKTKENLKAKRIVFGALSGGILLSIFAGVMLFHQSVSNTKSYYGNTYNEMRAQTFNEGSYGYDMVTSLKYYYISESPNTTDNVTVIFYETDNILYFNQCTYTISVSKFVEEKFGVDRYRYAIGSNLGVNSFECEFNYGSILDGTYFSCYFDYIGGKVDNIRKLKTIVSPKDDVKYDEALALVNSQIDRVETEFSKLMSKHLDKEVSFANDFLPAREKGRKVNFGLQISGLFLIIPGIIAFFVIFSIFIRSLIQNVRPRLVESLPNNMPEKHKPLPNDWKVNFGIPDMFIVLLGKILQYGSMGLFVIAFIARLGIPFLSFFSNPILLKVFQYSLLAGIFLEHFVMIGRIKNPTILFREIIYNMGMFLSIATLETVLIALTNAWGYSFASLVYKYVPSNVYQVVAVHYLIFLFLFFQPSFLKNKKKRARVLWHCCSFIPLGFLIATYFLSNSYSLVYGVQENIFINFWFPNGFLSFSIVCVLFLYIIFVFRLFFERRYGSHNSQLFFYGDRYTVYENTICAGLIIIAALLDIIFMNNQYAYYLGLGENLWLFTLVPFVLLCRYSPNNQQIFLMDEEFKTFVREEKKNPEPIENEL